MQGVAGGYAADAGLVPPQALSDPVASSAPPPEVLRQTQSADGGSDWRQRQRLLNGEQRFTSEMIRRMVTNSLLGYRVIDGRAVSDQLERKGTPTWESNIGDDAKSGKSSASPPRNDDVKSEGSPKCRKSPASPAGNDEAASGKSPVRVASAGSDYQKSTAAAVWKCGICMEEQSEPGVTSLCREIDCEQQFCESCIEDLCIMTANNSRFYLIPVRCPAIGCGRRVRTLDWDIYVDYDTTEKYEEGGKNILSYRCETCDSTGSLFTDTWVTKEERMEKLREMMPEESLEPWSNLQSVWAEFNDGVASAAEMLDAVLDALGYDEDDLEEFIGDSSEDSPLRKYLALIADVERRCVLHLEALRRHPQMYTPCCRKPFCWMCKICDHHPGLTCAQKQRDLLGYDGEVVIQFCPGCGAAVEKTEACDQMVCLCGEHFTWRGGEDSD